MAGVKGRSGAKPMPIEHHRRVGRSDTTKADGRPLADRDQTVKLEAPTEVPPPPDDLAENGLDLWNRCFTPPVTWISPVSDQPGVEAACRLADRFYWLNIAISGIERDDPLNVAAFKDLYGKLVTLSTEYRRALGDLGFTPAARSTLGVAEVVQTRTARGQEELPSGVFSLEELQNRKAGN